MRRNFEKSSDLMEEIKIAKILGDCLHQPEKKID